MTKSSPSTVGRGSARATRFVCGDCLEVRWRWDDEQPGGCPDDICSQCFHRTPEYHDARIRDLRSRGLWLPAAYDLLDDVERNRMRNRVPRAARRPRPRTSSSRLEDVCACVLIIALIALACLA